MGFPNDAVMNHAEAVLFGEAPDPLKIFRRGSELLRVLIAAQMRSFRYDIFYDLSDEAAQLLALRVPQRAQVNGEPSSPLAPNAPFDPRFVMQRPFTSF
jgi:hypothetical protein